MGSYETLLLDNQLLTEMHKLLLEPKYYYNYQFSLHYTSILVFLD